MVRLKFNHQDKMVMASVQQNAVPNPGNDSEKTTLVSNTFRSGHYGRYSKELWTTFCACLGPLSLGCVLGYSSPSLPDLTTRWSPSWNSKILVWISYYNRRPMWKLCCWVDGGEIWKEVNYHLQCPTIRNRLVVTSRSRGLCCPVHW